MPNTYIVNQKPTSYGSAMGLLADMLVGAGWTFQGSGSGTSGIFIQSPAPSSTVTISNASPAVVTWTSHPLSIGHGVIFTTDDTLPSPLVPNTIYYIIAAGFGANSFQISATAGGAAIDTTTAGSGTHTATASLKVFSTATSGVTSWSNANAWARIQDPSGTREFVFQHNNTQGVRFKYSPAAKFTGGSPSTTVVPTATDQQLFWGGGTDASPTFNNWFNAGIVASPSTIIVQGAAMDTAPYGFWVSSHVQGTSLIGGSSNKFATLMFDPVSTVVEDTDPYVIHVASSFGFSTFFNSGFGRDGGTASNNPTTWATTANSTDGCFAFCDPAQTQFLYVQPATYLGMAINSVATTPGTNASYQIAGGGNVFNAVIGLNPFNGKHEMLPIPYLRVSGGNSATFSVGNQTTKPMLKGWSTLMRWTGNSRNSFMDTLDNKSWICVGVVWLPWDGTTQPIA